MGNLTKVIKAIKEDNKSGLNELIIQKKLEELFKKVQSETKDEERKGLHASALIKSKDEFCYREQVLSLIYKRNDEQHFDFRTQNIFATGNDIHEKWQRILKDGGMAVGIERRRYSKKFDFYLTPDGELIVFFKDYILEIKSSNSRTFREMKKPHPTAEKQSNIYMHFAGMPRTIILVENKDTQEIKVFIIDYDPEIARPYIKRLYKVQDLKEHFDKTGQMVKRKCKNCDLKRAQRCPMRDACFNIGIGRIKLEANNDKST